MRVRSLRGIAQVIVVCLVAVLLEGSFQKAFAQSDLGRISGFITDPSGAAVPNAKVIVQNQSGVQREATTNESGYYVISNVPPGFYTMTAEAPGFQKYVANDNKLDSASNLVINATLVVGST